jgi:hypothetical protein
VKLARVRLCSLSPFEDVTISFMRDDGPRALTVVFGGDRTGKTTLLASIGTTRPGFATPPPPIRRVGANPPWIATDWELGEDDPERPHVLRVISPTAPALGETPEESAFRRKEQALFDRRAQEQGGFALVLVPSVRWFSRMPNMLTQPDKTIARYDVRAAPVLEDATRADLTRETKQILAYAAIGSALERVQLGAALRIAEAAAAGDEIGRLDAFHNALRETLAILLEPFHRTWKGVAPETLEPMFSDRGGPLAPFEELPRGARHLVAIAALAVRALASPTDRRSDIRLREGVVLVDDIEVGQDASILRILPQLLRHALPGVQWILTTSSPVVSSACAPGETIALRRSDELVEIHDGDLALLH